MNATVAACRTAIADLDLPANCRTVESRLESLPDRVALACFPEYALTGFVPDERARAAAIDRDGDTIDRVRAAASNAGCDVLVGIGD